MAIGGQPFQARLFCKPAGLAGPVSITVAGRICHALPAAQPALVGGLPITWEAASSALDELGAFVEPDGSFVWVSGGPPHWQVEGQLFERSDRLQFVEIKGRCPAANFDHLLSAFGWPAGPLVFELVQEGIFVDETEFRRLHDL